MVTETPIVLSPFKISKVRGKEEVRRFFRAPCCYHYEFSMPDRRLQELVKEHSAPIKCKSPDCGKMIWLFAIGEEIMVTNNEVIATATSESEFSRLVFQLHGAVDLDTRYALAKAKMAKANVIALERGIKLTSKNLENITNE